MNTSSECLTNGILIKVVPEYLEDKSIESGKKHLFSYRVTILNKGTEWVKLITRHWIIIDSNGNKEEVKGDGVVGYTPELKPGQSFTYTSYCPLDTDWGTMEGSYQMLKRDGSKFDAMIDRFFLVAPELIEK